MVKLIRLTSCARAMSLVCNKFSKSRKFCQFSKGKVGKIFSFDFSSPVDVLRLISSFFSIQVWLNVVTISRIARISNLIIVKSLTICFSNSIKKLKCKTYKVSKNFYYIATRK